MKIITRLIVNLVIGIVIAFSFITCPIPDGNTKPYLTGQLSFITTTLKVGELITAIYSNGNGTGQQTWQWYRVTPNSEVPITANGNTYTPVISDVGFPLKVALSFTDQNGSLSATTIQLVAFAATTPTAPQNFTAIPDNDQVELSWTAPSSDGGGEISSYQVSSSL